jgi:hypothetical protein
LNYLKVYKLEVGLLINFGSKSMTFKRLVRWWFEHGLDGLRWFHWCLNTDFKDYADFTDFFGCS